MTTTNADWKPICLRNKSLKRRRAPIGPPSLRSGVGESRKGAPTKRSSLRITSCRTRQSMPDRRSRWIRQRRRLTRKTSLWPPISSSRPWSISILFRDVRRLRLNSSAHMPRPPQPLEFPRSRRFASMGSKRAATARYDVQTGLEQPVPGAQAISTALGYNQLLATNSVSLMAEKGDQFTAALRLKVDAASGETRVALEQNLVALRRMVEFCSGVPDEWSEHEKLAATPAGLGIHALNLDLDIGPLLQAQKLLDSILFARANGISRSLSAAELEMMNFTGDGNGLDMIVMPLDTRTRVPTANFFQRRGYERNPIAGRHNVVAALLAATDAIMDRETILQGAKDLAAAFPK